MTAVIVTVVAELLRFFICIPIAFITLFTHKTTVAKYTYDFADYGPDQISRRIRICQDCGSQGYQVNEALYGEIVKGNYMRANDHSNGRWVRNLNEKLLRQVSTRVTREGSTDYNSILDQDLEALRENNSSEQPHTVDDQGYVLP